MVAQEGRVFYFLLLLFDIILLVVIIFVPALQFLLLQKSISKIFFNFSN